MKILGGKLKGRNFYMPEGIRPTQNLVRKALFDILGHDWSQIRFLELFAGSGAVGFEALSRGCKEVVLVEKEKLPWETIQENQKILLEGQNQEGLGKLQVIHADAFQTIKNLASKSEVFDVIFADPPYRRGLAKKVLKTINAYDILSRNCFVVIECETNERLLDEMGVFSLSLQKTYGKKTLYVFQRQGDKSVNESDISGNI